MSNENTVQLTIVSSKPTVLAGGPVQFFDSDQFDMTGDHDNGSVLDCTTTEAVVPLGSIGTCGTLGFKAAKTNTDYVILGTKPSGTFIEFSRLQAGRLALVAPRSTPIYAKSASGTQRVQFLALES